jgi:hypothetical protein
MKKYTDPNGQTWDVEFWASVTDNAVSCGSLVRNLAADLELAVAGWKARGEEIERLKAYAVAWEMWDYGTAPKRSEYGL